MSSKKKKGKTKNGIAKALKNPVFRQKVVPNKKKKKQIKEIDYETTEFFPSEYKKTRCGFLWSAELEI